MKSAHCSACISLISCHHAHQERRHARQATAGDAVLSCERMPSLGALPDPRACLARTCMMRLTAGFRVLNFGAAALAILAAATSPG